MLIAVGPEQAFTYAAALHPKMVFVIDIRRQNLLVHLMYKALFELSATRAEFISRLFSRRLPAGMDSKASAGELLRALDAVAADPDLFRENQKKVVHLLVEEHGFALAPEDPATLEKIAGVFSELGTLIANSSGRSPVPTSRLRASSQGRPLQRGPGNPSYAQLVSATDSKGKAWSFLETEAAYEAVRDLELRNLIVPVVGDWPAPKRCVGLGPTFGSTAPRSPSSMSRTSRCICSLGRAAPRRMPPTEAGRAT